MNNGNRKAYQNILQSIRLFSLVEIVEEFKLFEFSKLLMQLQGLESSVRQALKTNQVTLHSEAKTTMRKLMDAVGKYSNQMGFTEAANAAALTYMFVTSDASAHLVTLSGLEVELRHVKAAFMNDAAKRKLISIPSKPRNYSDYVNQDALFGSEVAESFPKAKDDVREAGNLLAVGSCTASVFHLMRVAERCLRFLAKRLKVSLTHKGAAHPIEFADWDKIITGCKNEIANARALPHGPKRQAKLELLTPMAPTTALS